MSTTVTSKGQVTIPKPVRDHLGIVPGSAIDFDMDADGRIVVIKSDGSKQPSRFQALLGLAETGLTTDEIMAMTRGD